ncbi:hypothetical protein ACMYZ8_12685 [Bacteroides sp. KG156]|uniref:hypothetical protein n=1 Tax=unclassified Bacteroides TaxID=2646097 RepID=UPI003D7F96C5
MKGLVKLLAVGMLVTVGGCSSSRLTNQYSINKINHDLNRWVTADSDSSFNSKKQYMDYRIRDYNLKQLRDDLNKDGNASYWGESIYYMLHGLFK